jgi:hypothetical protein
VIKLKMFMNILLVSCGYITAAQSTSYPMGAGATACGYTSVARTGFWAVFNNQAGTALLEHIHTGVFFENRYLIPEMGRVALGAFLPLKKGGMFINLDHSGGSVYSEMKAGYGYSMPLGKVINAGVQLDYLLMSIGEGYRNYHAVTFEAGIIATINDHLVLGLHSFNPVRIRWINTDEPIPVVMRGGLGFRPEGSITLYAEVYKSTEDPAMFCTGAEYNFRDIFFIRAGITSGPSRYTFGAGMKIHRLLIETSSSVHEWLGYSPQLSFTYAFE